MDELIKRIPDNMLVADAQAGEVWSHLDVNDVYTITKTAINANYFDIQKILKGDLLAGNSLALEGAKLSRLIAETMQNDDNKIPSSKQVKMYADAHINNQDIHTSVFEKMEMSDHINDDITHVTRDDKNYWGNKANINDIPTSVSELNNDLSLISINDIKAGSNVTLTKDILENTITINATGGSGSNGDIPTKTSQLINDSNFVVDNDYVHTDNNYTSTDKTKLAGIDVGANKYTHPSNHPASIITQDSNNRFVSDAEKTSWNSKQVALPTVTQAEAESGTGTDIRNWTPQRVKQAIQALAPAGGGSSPSNLTQTSLTLGNWIIEADGTTGSLKFGLVS